MIAQDHDVAITQIGNQTFPLVMVEGDAFIVMIGNTGADYHGRLRQGQQAVGLGRYRHPVVGVQMHDTSGVRPRPMHGAMDRETGGIDLVIGLGLNIALEVDLDQG